MAKRGGQKPKQVVPTGGWQAGAKAEKSPVVESISGVGGKRPAVLGLEEEDVRARRLVWRFAEADTGGQWPPAGVTTGELSDLLQKMASFESMTIGEIFRLDSEHGKKYSVEKLPQRAKKRLAELERDDETELARLRCGGKPRLYGFLREHVFHVLWWDREHQVYPSKKKNT